ncbi:hypothetical protein H6G89_32005 [Oscillatoria sp. FACHB-1407]|uniref:hypothetical protein n=1 Tax=Oscillatoria sp. FACHB-1407 TaxID=2692847 RepID=UPI0016853C42|nr:hypothetical protein [Oscillatoria sp. FACHB-1407]MBD2465618.1 hypothetical protein [Oscillatoria sp. FACHB-1407]
MANQINNSTSSQSHPFDPEQDPLIRKWSARLNLPSDDRIVVITAEVERIRESIVSQLESSELTFKELQELWGASFNQTNITLSQALSLIQQQQSNQTALTQTYSSLTDSLLKFEEVLNTLSERTNELLKPSQELASVLKPELLALKSSNTSIQNTISSLKSENRTIYSCLSDIKTAITTISDRSQKLNLKPWWVQWLIVVLLVLNVVLSIPHDEGSPDLSLGFANRDLNYVATRSEWTLTKLERIEKALGIQN